MSQDRVTADHVADLQEAGHDAVLVEWPDGTIEVHPDRAAAIGRGARVIALGKAVASADIDTADIVDFLGEVADRRAAINRVD